MSVDPSAWAAITAKKGRWSMLRPGKGIGWILSIGARRVDGEIVGEVHDTRHAVLNRQPEGEQRVCSAENDFDDKG
jgi:hypothetical protein